MLIISAGNIWKIKNPTIDTTAPAFVGSKPFSTANRCLEKMGAEPIDWSLP